MYDETCGQPSQEEHNQRQAAFNSQWLSKKTHDVDLDETQHDTKLWTFIYRGLPPRFDPQSRTQCIYVDHGDHWHFVFQASPQNKQRTFQRIITVSYNYTNIQFRLEIYKHPYPYLQHYNQLSTGINSPVIS